jgi:hypothetical protein
VTFHVPRGSFNPQLGLLACVVNILRDGGDDFAGRRASPADIQGQGVQLIREWEEAKLPLAFVMSPVVPYANLGNRVCEHRRIQFSRPRPGDLIFWPETPSLLRDRKFSNFYQDIGKPTIFFIGDALDEIMLATSVDGCLSACQVKLIKELCNVNENGVKPLVDLRSTALELVSRFAPLISLAEVRNDCSRLF